MEPAKFSLVNYRFDQVTLNLDKLQPKTSFDIDFDPSGLFDNETKTFILTFVFSAANGNTSDEIIKVRCVAEFSFLEINGFSDIPAYFYNNSIAILFPYIRAFVSTITLQANIPPILLPTLNLSDLKERLIKNTVEK